MITGWPLTEASAFNVPRYTIDHHQLALSWDLKCEVTLSHSHSGKSSNWWIESHHPASHPSPASNYLSDLGWSWLTSASANWVDCGLGVHLEVHLLIASKLSQFCPPNPLDRDFPSASPILPNNILQVGTIMAFKCISKLTQSPPVDSPDIPWVDG